MFRRQMIVWFGGWMIAGCTTNQVVADREPSNMGGANYNVGTFVCKDQTNGLESRFTFGASTANFSLKGTPVAMDCGSVTEASNEEQSLFRNSGKRLVDLCRGSSDKGRIVAATSNSMGAVQMTAMLLEGGKVTAQAILNCASAPRNSGGW